jgi:hypothetical protein
MVELLPSQVFKIAWKKLQADVRARMGSWGSDGKARLLDSPAYTMPNKPQRLPTNAGKPWIKPKWVKTALKSLCYRCFGDQTVAQAILLTGRCPSSQDWEAWQNWKTLPRLSQADPQWQCWRGWRQASPGGQWWEAQHRPKLGRGVQMAAFMAGASQSDHCAGCNRTSELQACRRCWSLVCGGLGATNHGGDAFVAAVIVVCVVRVVVFVLVLVIVAVLFFIAMVLVFVRSSYIIDMLIMIQSNLKNLLIMIQGN